jgi:hypothetical protein
VELVMPLDTGIVANQVVHGQKMLEVEMKLEIVMLIKIF